MKIFLAVGNKDLEDIIKLGKYEVLDSEDNLVALLDLIDYINIEGLVINRLLDSDGLQLVNVAKKASGKGIKVIVLTNDYTGYEERKLVTNLVNVGVNAFILLKDLTQEKITSTFEHYPKEFDFSLFSEARVEYIETVKSVFKESIVIYSPLSQGSSTIAAHLAVALAGSKNCRVCLADFNPLKPVIMEKMDMSTEYTLTDAMEGVVKGSLTTEKLESITKQSKYQRNLDVLAGIYDMNDYYTSSAEQFEEILEKLKFNYDYVIVDTAFWYDIISSDAALRKADRILVPVMGTRDSINALNRYISMFEKYQDFDLRKFQAVINSYSGEDLTSIEIKSMLKIPVAGFIEENKGYKRGNLFKNKNVLNEYIDLLNNIGIEAKRKHVLFGLKAGSASAEKG